MGSDSWRALDESRAGALIPGDASLGAASAASAEVRRQLPAPARTL